MLFALKKDIERRIDNFQNILPNLKILISRKKSPMHLHQPKQPIPHTQPQIPLPASPSNQISPTHSNTLLFADQHPQRYLHCMISSLNSANHDLFILGAKIDERAAMEGS